MINTETAKRGKIIWVLPKWPLPADDGAKIASLSLLRYLNLSDYEVHLIALSFKHETYDFEKARQFLKVDRLTVVPFKRRGFGRIGAMLLALFKSPLAALTLQNYASPEVRATIAKEIATSDGKCIIVYDGLHGAAHALQLGQYHGSANARVIYRAHNREALLWERKAAQTSNIFKKALLSWQSRRVRLFEDSLVRAAKVVACVSEEDRSLFVKNSPYTRVEVVLIGSEFGKVPPFASGPAMQIMFIGRLDWYPNRDGLRWFLTQVWPAVRRRRKDLTLSIIGSGSCGKVKQLAKQDGVTFVGRVDNLDRAYLSSCLSVIPIFYGGGTRVKAIEAARYGRPVLSTEVGVEGLGLEAGKSYIRAETDKEWIQALVNLEVSELKKIGHLAHEELGKRFDATKCANEFRTLVDYASDN